MVQHFNSFLVDRSSVGDTIDLSCSLDVYIKHLKQQIPHVISSFCIPAGISAELTCTSRSALISRGVLNKYILYVYHLGRIDILRIFPRLQRLHDLL